LGALGLLVYTLVTTRFGATTSRGMGTLRGTLLVAVILVKGHVFPTKIGNVTILMVYYVERLAYNLFLFVQFCDSDLKVAFKQHTCFVRNLEAPKTKSWLWHRRLSHLNFGAINHLDRNSLVHGVPKLKFEKDHFCSACAMAKARSNPINLNLKTPIKKNYIFCMSVASVNGQKYILIIMDDYSRFTWEKFLTSKDEAPDFIIKFIKMIHIRLNATVRNIRTDNGTEFVNQTLCDYYEQVGISYETSVARTTQQIGVVERKPYLSYLYVFGSLCYPNNESENLGKLQAKADIGIFIGYAPKKKAYRIYNQRTQKITETIHVEFDELTTMAFEQSSLEPALHEMSPATPSSGLVLNPPHSTSFVSPLRHEWDLLFNQCLMSSSLLQLAVPLL
nr:hypothetical protein [Tanacetum cinerariifolium]